MQVPEGELNVVDSAEILLFISFVYSYDLDLLLTESPQVEVRAAVITDLLKNLRYGVVRSFLIPSRQCYYI